MEYKSAVFKLLLILVPLLFFSCTDESPVTSLGEGYSLCAFANYTTTERGGIRFYDSFNDANILVLTSDYYLPDSIPNIDIYYYTNGIKTWIYAYDPNELYHSAWNNNVVENFHGGQTEEFVLEIGMIPISSYTSYTAVYDTVFMPSEYGYFTSGGEGTLEEILQLANDNNWQFLMAGPTVLNKLGLESETDISYKISLYSNSTSNWLSEINSIGFNDFVNYEYAYYDLSSSFEQFYTDLSETVIENNLALCQDKMTVLYLTDITTYLGARAVLRWNTGVEIGDASGEWTDVDIHIWDEFGNHAFYVDKEAIPGSFIDIDNTWGFGPETYTVTDVTSRYYVFEVNFYSGHSNYNPTSATVDIYFGSGVQQYGPHTFSSSDYNGSDPGAWWSIGAIDVSGELLDITIPPGLMDKIAEDKIIIEQHRKEN